MKKYAIALVLGLCLMACGEVADEDLEIESKEEAVICYGFPFKTMAFPVDQGLWLGNGAGQEMAAPFPGPTCPAVGDTLGYGQLDGEINLIRNIGWAPSTCVRINNGSVNCNSQAFTCPVNACLTLPSTWQTSANPPDNVIVWDWVNPAYTSAPGRHGIWPMFQNQCSNGAPFLQINPNGSGGSTLSCRYPMGTFWLRQF